MKSRGFTIVELLIVIVVIAILAAITIVSYNGIQNRANETAVQSDMRNMANLVEQHAATTGNYPATLEAAGITMGITRTAIDLGVSNGYFCALSTDASKYAIGFKVKSGSQLRYVPCSGFSTYTLPGGLHNSSTVCPALLGLASGATNFTFSYAYNFNGTWQSWVK
jgi:prepilin-type N-terminal cleavage/methylation domain-containing protein